MTTDQIKFTDGRLHEVEVFGEGHTDFPFKGNIPADRHARVHTRKHWINPLGYVSPLTTRTSYTNLLSLSDSFAPATWTNDNGLTRTEDNAANPWDGATTVDRLVETAANTTHRTGRAYTFTAVSHCLWAIVAPYGARRYVRLLANDGTTDFSAVFDLTNGQVKSVAGSGATAAILKLEDGYFRVALVFTPLAAAGNFYLNTSADGTTFSFAGDTAKGLYLAQVQLELATAPGPLILTTSASRSVLAPPRDPQDIFAYLVTEDELVEYGGGMCTVTRRCARIPRRQWTYPGARYVTKPDYTPGGAFNPFDVASGLAISVGFGNYYPTWSDRGEASYSTANGIYTATDGAVYNPVKLPTVASQTVGQATAGTFTLTRGANTTGALNYNDSNATIAAAINALAGVVSAGLTFSVINSLNYINGGQLYMAVSGGSEADRQVPVTMDATSLTVSTSKHPTTYVVGSSLQYIMLPTHLVITGHALDTSKALAVVWYNGGTVVTFIYPTGYWGSHDANTVWVPSYGGGVFGATYVGIYSTVLELSAAASYQGGTRLPSRQIYTDFYLPGVSEGITTPADITTPAGMQNPNTFLTALLTPLTGYQDFDTDGASAWLGLIYGRPVTQINFSQMT